MGGSDGLKCEAERKGEREKLKELPQFCCTFRKNERAKGRERTRIKMRYSGEILFVLFNGSWI